MFEWCFKPTDQAGQVNFADSDRMGPATAPVPSPPVCHVPRYDLFTRYSHALLYFSWPWRPRELLSPREQESDKPVRARDASPMQLKLPRISLLDTWPRAGVADSDTEQARWTRRLTVSFYLSIMSVALIDVCFAFLFPIPVERFLPTTIVLIVATLAGARVLFKPIARYLASPDSEPLPVRAIVWLPRHCTVYVSAVITVLAATKFILLPALLGFELSTVLSPVEQMTLPWIHICYYAALCHFAMSDYAATLRLAVFERTGKRLPAGKQHLAANLLIAFAATSLLPLALIASQLGDGPVTMRELLPYFGAMAIGIAAALWFVARSMLRPIRALDVAVGRVCDGQLDITAPVLSGDETGRLARRFNTMTEGLRERAFIKDTFGKYVPERIARDIMAYREPVRPQLRTATIVYTDLQDFTAISETLSPDHIVERLNEYFSAIIEPVELNAGVVNQFQGDAMLITFNIPLEEHNHAAAAIEAATAIRRICAERTFAGCHCVPVLASRPEKSSPATWGPAVDSITRCMATR